MIGYDRYQAILAESDAAVRQGADAASYSYRDAGKTPLDCRYGAAK